MVLSGFRPTVIRLCMIGLSVLGVVAARAAETKPTTTAVGAWDLSLDNGSRQCRLMLRADVAASGYAVGMPAGCHLAFPFLVSVKMWSDAGDGKLRFEDAKGQPLLIFEPGQDGVLASTGPEGEVLRLSSVGAHRTMVLKSPSVKTAEVVKSEPVKPTTPKLPLPTVAEMAGHYAVLRGLGKDTGCMVTFDDKSHGPNGSLKANLAPACRDQGIVIFDPVGWQLAAGRLVLTARKGHNTKLDLQGDGSWAKDAKEGIGLSLKRM